MSTEEIAPGSITHIVSANLSGDVAQTGDEALKPKTDDELAAERALSDLDAAAEMSEGGRPRATAAEADASDSADAPVEDPKATRERLMKKAARQRENGRKALTTHESGIVLVPVNARIGDKVLGSSFERYVGAIDMCAHNLNRYGEMVMGAQFEDLLTKLAELVDEFARDTADESGRVEQLVREAEAQAEQEKMPFVRPAVLKPAVELEVVFRTPLGLKMYKAIIRADRSLETMSALEWNDAVDVGEVAKRQFLFKQGIGKIYGFASRTNLGLRRRAAGPVKKAKTDTELAA